MKLRLRYYKPDSGKFYSAADYDCPQEHFFQAVEEVSDLWRLRELPGLIRGHSPFVVHVESEENGSYGALIGLNGVA